MALPDNTLSTLAAPAEPLAPDDTQRTNLLEDFELGGIAISDPSQGQMVQVWRCWSDGESVWVAPVSGGVTTLLFADAGITEVSLAFNRNMRPTIGYMAGGVMKLYWYDSVVEDYVNSTFEGRSPFLTTDDKRDFNSANADVLFFYVRAGKLRYRQQRDRYTIERDLADVPSGSRVSRVGMSSGYRIQVEITLPFLAPFNNMSTDELFVVNGTDIVKLDGGAIAEGAWRSRVYELHNQPPMAWARVEGDFPVTFTLLVDGGTFYTKTVLDERPFRVPVGRYREWQVEVRSSKRILGVWAASSAAELKGDDLDRL